MAKKATLKEIVLDACREDYVGLWELVNIVEREFPRADLVTFTMGFLRNLLSEGLIRAGEPTRDGKDFVAWGSNLEETLSRIEFEWRRLRRKPTLGEIVWFEEAPREGAGLSVPS